MKQYLCLFQQAGPERGRIGSPLLARTKIILSVLVTLFLTGCCVLATNSRSFQETAFTAKFLGFAKDGQTLLVQPEQSKANVQLVYDNAENLIIGQRVYVVGRLEGNQVYVTDLRPL